MSRTLKIGVVGGRRGLHVASAIPHIAGAELAVVCDILPETQERGKKDFPAARFVGKYEDLLAADVDAVFVATPPMVHAQYTTMALQAGKHVLCEVPAFHAKSEMAPLVAAVRKAKTMYMFAENVMYWAFVQEMAKRIRAGELGKIMYAEAEYIHELGSMYDYRLWCIGYPCIHYCTHSLGPVLEWMGEEVVLAVGLHTGVQYKPQRQTANMEAALYQTRSGSVIKQLCGFSVCRQPHFHRYVLYGTEGFFERTSPMDRPGEYFLATGSMGPTARPAKVEMSETWKEDAADPKIAALHGGADYRMMKDFVGNCLGGGKSPIDIDQAVRMTLPGLCAHESATRGGTPVKLEYS